MAFHSFFILFLVLCVVPCVPSLPFVVLHGLGANCAVVNCLYTRKLENYSGSQGYCIEVGDGPNEICDSFFVPMEEQVRSVCDQVKKMDNLSEGYNLFAVSQGNMIARALIEFCDDAPPVKNYVSLGGPHAGVACIPSTNVSHCKPTNDMLKGYIYTDCFQGHIGPVGYYKIPDDIDNYLANSKFLPKLNNENPNDRNETYKTRFASLENLVLIMSDNDTVLIPKETSWFGYFNESYETVPVQETKLYTEDWIGLKELDEAGNVSFVTVPGTHVNITDDDMKKYIVPFLENKAPASISSVSKSKDENRRMVGLSSFK